MMINYEDIINQVENAVVKSWEPEKLRKCMETLPNLSKQEIIMLRENPNVNDDELFRPLFFKNISKPTKRNTPITTLIQNYQNKKSGKVEASRKEIQRRFNYLDWRHQKKILVLFINGSATDRNWASRKMFAYWDKSFIPLVKGLWEKYHEEPLLWLIIQYFPVTYLKQHSGELIEEFDISEEFAMAAEEIDQKIKELEEMREKNPTMDNVVDTFDLILPF